jgi:hypothetical protein
MSEEILISASFPATAGIIITAMILVLNFNWRVSIIALSVQYVGVFILTSISWPIEMAATKLVAGWMACAVLGIASSEVISGVGSLDEAENAWPSSRIFRSLAALLIVLPVLSVAPRVVEWAPRINYEQSMGGSLLIGLGLLQLGFTANPLRMAIGLLTLLAGFEIIHSSVETSALLTGLLAAVTLGIALVTAYMMIAPQLEETE